MRSRSGSRTRCGMFAGLAAALLLPLPAVAQVQPGRGEVLPASKLGAGARIQPAAQVPPAAVPPSRTPAEGDDLAKLSLEELLELEILPINVLGGHTHPAGQWMAGYRYMGMSMSGYRSGTRQLTDREVLRRFPTVHTEMFMSMHMLELMHAPSDRLTYMAMLNYKEMEMKHLTRMGHRFSTRAEGFGDLTLMALQTLRGDIRKGGGRLLLNAGLSIPTGSTDVRDDTPTRRNARLEYPMQLGSGTVDLLPGLTFLDESDRWSWGAQGLATVRVGSNSEGYRFGNQYRVSGWAAYKVSDWVAPSLRLDYHEMRNVHGRDPELDPRANPESNPDLQAGRRLDLVAGLNLYAPRGRLKGHRVMLEAGIPLYRSLTGPQIETDWQVSIGWSYTFQR